VQEPIEKRSGPGGIVGQSSSPQSENKIAGDHGAGPFVALDDDMEGQVRFLASEGQIPRSSITSNLGAKTALFIN
jgi:hypothetical protein